MPQQTSSTKLSFSNHFHNISIQIISSFLQAQVVPPSSRCHHLCMTWRAVPPFDSAPRGLRVHHRTVATFAWPGASRATLATPLRVASTSTIELDHTTSLLPPTRPFAPSSHTSGPTISPVTSTHMTVKTCYLAPTISSVTSTHMTVKTCYLASLPCDPR